MDELGKPHDRDQRRLFIVGSETSLKAVLIHHDSRYPSIPVAYSVTSKETYANMELMIDLIKFKQ